MDGGLRAGRHSGTREVHLERAYDEIATFLESVDLGAESELADETIAALAAVDRAYELADTSD